MRGAGTNSKPLIHGIFLCSTDSSDSILPAPLFYLGLTGAQKLNQDQLSQSLYNRLILYFARTREYCYVDRNSSILATFHRHDLSHGQQRFTYNFAYPAGQWIRV